MEDTLKLKEVWHIVLKDENGNIKDERIITNGVEEIITNDK